jgi:hypothetical protein
MMNSSVGSSNVVIDVTALRDDSRIIIYVRKPEGSTPEREIRRLSFEVPKHPKMGYNTVYAIGFVMDGTHAIRDVVQEEGRPFSEQLRTVEQEIVSTLKKLGTFDVGEFR